MAGAKQTIDQHVNNLYARMQIQSFKVFSNLAETSSFSKAAQMNGLTQSAVSQQLRALERRFRSSSSSVEGGISL